MLNLLAGLAEGFNNSQRDNLEQQQKADLRKLQIKQFQRELDAKEQADQAKKGLIDFITKAGLDIPGTPGTPAVPAPQGYENFDPGTPATPGTPAMPGMNPRQALQTPQGLALALGAGHSFSDLKQFTQPSLVDQIAEYQKKTAMGGNAPNGIGALPVNFRVNADGTGYFENIDPTKLGELDVHRQRLAADIAKLQDEGVGVTPSNSGAGVSPKASRDIASKRAEEKPQVLAAIRNTNNGFDRLKSAALELINNPELKNATGFRTPLGVIPGTEAKGVQADIENLKSQIGFTVMQTLRDSGKTGSTGLGALNESELKAVQSNLASLDPQQKTEKLKKNLQKIVDYVDEAKQRQIQHYRDAYNEPFPTNGKNSKPSLDSFSGAEQTAVNPSTGERLVLRGGQWVKP